MGTSRQIPFYDEVLEVLEPFRKAEAVNLLYAEARSIRIGSIKDPRSSSIRYSENDSDLLAYRTITLHVCNPPDIPYLTFRACMAGCQGRPGKAVVVWGFSRRGALHRHSIPLTHCTQGTFRLHRILSLGSFTNRGQGRLQGRKVDMGKTPLRGFNPRRFT